jgi:hypothetical protein
VGTPKGKRPLGKTSRRRIILKWVYNKWDGSMGWTDMAQKGIVLCNLVFNYLSTYI